MGLLLIVNYKRKKNKKSILQKGALTLVKFYRSAISPLFPPCCRYVPTCSEYAIIALQKYGFCRGSWMTLKRISRCHPWHEGGYDPVP